jgi:hypothetical protein
MMTYFDMGGLYRHNTVSYMLDAGYNFGKATEWKEILNFCIWAETSKHFHLMLLNTKEVDLRVCYCRVRARVAVLCSDTATKLPLAWSPSLMDRITMLALFARLRI